MVRVRDIKDVAGAEKQIKALGFRTSSMENIRKPMEREAGQASSSAFADMGGDMMNQAGRYAGKNKIQ